MKILTLNTHSLHEENYSQKLKQFIEVVMLEKPDVIAIQEVNQTITAPLADTTLLIGFYPCPDENTAKIRQNNHAAQVTNLLRSEGVSCSWTWISFKIGYDEYDEGMALITINHEITSVESFFISKTHDYKNWKTRKVLGVQISGCKDWFYTVHMGWWNDEEEPFSDQWKKLNTIIEPKKNEKSNIWLMGDFNSPAELRNQGYDCIKESSWYDTYLLADVKDDGFTVKGSIDGWRSSSKETKSSVKDGMRIDQIWCFNHVNVKSSKVVFNGINEPIVSDHFGVLITI